jgi:hypothetical protein
MISYKINSIKTLIDKKWLIYQEQGFPFGIQKDKTLIRTQSS